MANCARPDRLIAIAGAYLLSSPDIPPITVATWTRLAPADFLATASSELDGTSETGGYPGQPWLWL